MRKYALRDIKNLVTIGAAQELQDITVDIVVNCDKIGVSFGKNGINGGLLQDTRDGKLYTISSKSSLLFCYFTIFEDDIINYFAVSHGKN